MKLKRRPLAALAAAGLLVGVAVLALTAFAGGAAGSATNNNKMRWDIISLDFTTFTLSAGGPASALADDGSKITLRGNGTFRSNPGHPQDVTGGGTWETFNSGGTTTGSGTYDVTGLVSFVVAPGALPGATDTIGVLANIRAGLLVVQISYSDGSSGVLTVSCNLVGTPASVFEGVTASKNSVDYWNRVAPPAPPGNANRTAFHIL